MRIDNINNQMLQGKLTSGQKVNKVADQKNSEDKNVIDASKQSSYSKRLESIQEQMNKVKEDDSLDSETKKTKIKELQEQMNEIRKKGKEAQVNKLAEKNKPEEEKAYAQSADGDKLILTENMKNMIQNDVSLDKAKEKNSDKVELQGENEILKNQIETDLGRGVDTTKKEEELAKKEEKVSEINNNEMEKINNSNKEKTENKEMNVEEVNKKQNEKVANQMLI